jgi:hypothetical protein
MTRKAVKGSAIADHLADNTIEDFDFPDKNVLLVGEEEKKIDWCTMNFDEVVNVYGNGADAITISFDKKQYLVSVKLKFKCTNNITEYEAYIFGLKAMLELKIR